MKKLLTILAVFVACSLAISAQTFAAKGGVYAEFGMDVDNLTTGFDIGLSDLDFTATVGDPKSIEKVGEEDIYGEIIIKNLRISTLDADKSGSDDDKNALTTSYNPGDWGYEAIALRWDTLSARLVFGDNFNVGLWGYSTAYTSYSKYNGLDVNWGFLKNAYDYSLFDGYYGDDNVTAAQYNSWDMTNNSPNNRVYFKPHSFESSSYTKDDGISLNLAVPQVLDASVYLESYKVWSSTSRFASLKGEEFDAGDNAYGITAMVSLTAVENLTFKALTKFDLDMPVSSATSSMAPAVAALASYKIALGEDVSITPSVAFDGQFADYSGFENTLYSTKSLDGFDWGLAGGLAVALKNTSINLNVGTGTDAGIDDSTTSSADESFATSSLNFTGSVSFGLIDGLIVKGAFEYIDPVFAKTVGGTAVDAAAIAEDATVGIAAEVGYDIKVTEKGVLTPFVKFSTDNKDGNSAVAGEDDYAMYFKVGAALTGVVENTKLYIEWDSNDLADTENYTDTEVIGQIVVGTKITF